MRSAQKDQINLLPKSELEKSSLGKILNWGLSGGRYIIILTELIAILCWFSRFKLDRDLKKLGTSIQEKQEIVASYEEFEKEVRHVQTRLKTAAEIKSKDISFSDIASDLAAITPIDVIYKEVEISKKGLVIKGTSLSNLGLKTLLSELKKQKRFSKINLSQVSSGGKQNPALEFTLEVALNAEEENAL